jgi:hypothetical protein
MKLILERFALIAKQDGERVIVDGFATAPTLELKAQAVMLAVANGQVPAETGERLLRTLDAYARVVVAEEHEHRLRASERGASAPKPITFDEASGPANRLVLPAPTTPDNYEDLA